MHKCKALDSAKGISCSMVKYTYKILVGRDAPIAVFSYTFTDAKTVLGSSQSELGSRS